MGKSTFLTGSAGSGKTYVLNQYIDFLKRAGINVAVTASTGIAATHINGMTIHSWSGIGIKDAFEEGELKQIKKTKKLKERFESVQVLVIDEISMLDGCRLDMVDGVLRYVREPDEPFGGIQVVFSGDFFQLPPVTKRGEQVVYAYESDSWKRLNPAIAYLETVHRHTDADFHNLLTALRERELDEYVYDLLSERGQVETPSRDMTRLYTHNRDVDSENASALEKIDEEPLVFKMQESGRKTYVSSLKRGCLAPEVLDLKVGAEVMFVKNDPGGRYVNGTRGSVVDVDIYGFPVVSILDGDTVVAKPVDWSVEEDGKILASVTQIPLRLAWAITVHKSQGMTLDEAEIDLSNAFVPGQGYVALSRVRGLSGLFLKGMNQRALEVDPRVSVVDKRFLKLSEAAALRIAELGEEEIEAQIKDFVHRSGGHIPKEGEEAPQATHFTSESTFETTRGLLNKGLGISEIAKERELAQSTIIGHIENLIEEGVEIDLASLVPKKKKEKKHLEMCTACFIDIGEFRLSPVKDHLAQGGIKVSYDDLKVARLFLPRDQFRELKKKCG